MPRFYFDLHDGGITLDREGSEFPGVRKAIDHALEEVRYMAAVSVRSGTLELLHRIDIRNDEGNVVAEINFGEAVRVTREGEPV